MFLTESGDMFDAVAFVGLQIVASLPTLNEEISLLTDIAHPLSIRVSCDSGVVTWDPDPSVITADFINKFIKNERLIGLTNSVTVTSRIWKQLSDKLRTKFEIYKKIDEIDADVYAYCARDGQKKALNSLRNIGGANGGGTQEAFAEIIAMKGDTLESLSEYAYADVMLKTPVKNVGGINLLITKNSEICQRHTLDDKTKSDEMLLNDLDLQTNHKGILMEALHSADPSGTPGHRIAIQIIRKANNYYSRIRNLCEHANNHGVNSIVSELSVILHENKQKGINPSFQFSGGESLRFYNCAALGFEPVIGSSTLLDHALAGNLVIDSVIGGVHEPATKIRTFKLHDDSLTEDLSSNQEGGQS